MTGDVLSFPVSEDEIYGGKWQAEAALPMKGMLPSSESWSGGLPGFSDERNIGSFAQSFMPDSANAHDEDLDAGAAVSAETAVLHDRTDLSADLAWKPT